MPQIIESDPELLVQTRVFNPAQPQSKSGSVLPGTTAKAKGSTVPRTASVPIAYVVNIDEYPQIGERLLQYEIVEELGRGAFARVYLAKEESLADRLVALKVGTVPSDEPQKLARLCHTNIVPVYSYHASGSYNIVCMPFLGRQTLHQVNRRLFRSECKRLSGWDLGQHLRPEGTTPTAPKAGAVCESDYAGRTFAEAVLMLGAELADGLDHAHRQGILHRDLKPANILLTDDGVPMILDFNVSSESAQVAENERIGGTLPYMSPEHIRAYMQKGETVDARSDLFSLGIVLFELLTGESPNSVTLFSRGIKLEKMLAERMKQWPPPSHFNSTATPAIDAIFAKLLAPNPAERYATAADFREDCERHLSNRPLKFAANSSLRERAGKWRRRHPRQATALIVGAAALFLVVLPVVGIARYEQQLVRRSNEIRSAEAELKATDSIAELHRASLLLESQSEPGAKSRGLALVKKVISQIGLQEDKPLEALSSFSLVSENRRNELRDKLGETLISTARAEAAEGGFSPEAIRQSLHWIDVARRQFPEGTAPEVLQRQREELLARQAGKTVPTPALPPGTAKDAANDYFNAVDLAVAGRYREALPLLTRICDKQPTRFRAWFSLGICQDALGYYADAASSFAVCIALEPESDFSWTNRGISLLRLNRYQEAESDLTAAIELKPKLLQAWINRGLARMYQGKKLEAEADFTQALADPEVPTRVYFLRSLVRTQLRNNAGAEADRRAGLELKPNDVDSWIARGTWRQDAKEFDKARSDYETALRLQPNCCPALQNIGVLYADHLNRVEDAIPFLDRVLEIQPGNIEARAGRGVYLARIGRLDEARRDAEKVLQRDQSGFRLYQMAGLYAQISNHPDTSADKQKCLELMGRALRAGFRDWATMKGDGDIDPVRNDVVFKRLLSAAEFLDAPVKANSGKAMNSNNP